MARYHDPKTGKTVEAPNMKEAFKPVAVEKKKTVVKKKFKKED